MKVYYKFSCNMLIFWILIVINRSLPPGKKSAFLKTFSFANLF